MGRTGMPEQVQQNLPDVIPGEPMGGRPPTQVPAGRMGIHPGLPNYSLGRPMGRAPGPEAYLPSWPLPGFSWDWGSGY